MNKSELSMSCNSIIAGLLIGLGVIINVQTQPPILGALLFSFGLLTIIYLKLPLFTGRVGFLEGNLPAILMFNFGGIALIVTLYFLSNPNFEDILTQAGVAKFSKTYIQMFFGGVFCGILIHFAVKCRVPYLTTMAVIIFILIGAEHCVADFPYFMVNFSIINFMKLLTVVIGNSIGAIFIEGMIKNE